MKKAGALHRKFKLQEGSKTPGQVCQGSGISTSGTTDSQASLRAGDGEVMKELIGSH